MPSWRSYLLLSGLILLLTSVSCKKDAIVQPTENQRTTPPIGFPQVSWPEDNAYSEARWQLGKKLFYDPILSIDSSLSCASCHAATLAFADTVALSAGVFGRPGVRNAPSLANVAYHPYFLREGSVPTLEMQVLVPIQEANEFNHNIVDIAEALVNIPEYVTMSEKAYGRLPDPFVITRALATFERTLLSGNSRYDQYQNGDGSALTASEIRGMNLFFSTKTNCATCHGGFNFTVYGFENNGLYTQYTDIGRMRFTEDTADNALFKTPSLRNVALTPPYMHDGSLKTLADVVQHYNNGGQAHPHKSALIKPLNLSAQEQNDLIAFLQSLSDVSFITNPDLVP